MRAGPAFFASTGPVVWNPADKAAEVSLSNGNLTATRSGGGVNNNAAVRGTTSKNSGKSYFEIHVDTSVGSASGDYSIYGIASAALGLNAYVGSTAASYGYEHSTGVKYTNGSGTALGAALAAGDVLGVAVDLDAGKMWFAKNNTWQGSGNPGAGTNPAFTGVSGTFYPAASLYKTATTQHVLTARFAPGILSYSPPSGFSAWE